MQIKLFNIPVPGGEGLVEEMNGFLRSKKILQLENQLVSTEKGTFYCFCIKYLDDSPHNNKTRIDYRQILDAESFARFAELRKVRKALAQKEGVPAYAVFTDEELAGLAKLSVLTPESMRSVRGVGEKKIAKYGAHFFTAGEHEEGK